MGKHSTAEPRRMSSESAKYPPARPPHSIAVVQQYNSVITGAQSISVLVGKLYSLVNKVEFFLSHPPTSRVKKEL